MLISLPALNRHQLATSGRGSISDDGSSDVPEMIVTASLQLPPEDDSDSLSSSGRSLDSTRSPVPSSPRSIFGRYWSSPTNKNGLEEMCDDDSEDEVMARLRKLQLPSLAITDDAKEEDSATDANKIVQVEPKKCFDDDAVDYQAALVSKPSPTRETRRKILPTPPPSTAVSSSLLQPRRPPTFLLPPKSLSASALLVKKPRSSCLRKSRYSCSAIVTRRDAVAAGRLRRELRNDGSPDLRSAVPPLRHQRTRDDRHECLFESHSPGCVMRCGVR